MKKLKYASVFALPVSVYVAFQATGGCLTHLPVLLFFGLVPLLELMLKPNNKNLTEREKKIIQRDWFYDVLIYLVVPVQIIFLILFLFAVSQAGLTPFELLDRISSMGLMCGVIGINLGHELGHRSNRAEQFLGELLLLTSLENHFLPYHNYGHHKLVATSQDPATARRGESVFAFWFRSHFGSYFFAWRLEWKRLKSKNKKPLSFNNRMVSYTVAQALLLGIIFYFFGATVMLYFVVAAAFGIMLLETVNYIEHYGLLRRMTADGVYESVHHQHSWNSDQVLGRILLFELSRHSRSEERRVGKECA